MTHRPYLVALDIDGTLLDFDGALSDRVRGAVQAVATAGHHVVIATGRQPQATLPVLDRLGLDHGMVVTSNGTTTLRLDPLLDDGYEFVESVTFDPSAVMEKVRAELPLALLAVEAPDGTLRVTGEFPPGEILGDYEVVPYTQLANGPATRVVVRSVEHTSHQFDEIVARMGLHGVSYAIGWSAWLDIAPDGVSKASALESIRRKLRVEPDHTLAIGDGRNDLEMLAWAAQSFAMGQASDVVLAAAKEICPPVDDDGAAAVLEGLLAATDLD